jgi:hypothetical protein
MHPTSSHFPAIHQQCKAKVETIPSHGPIHKTEVVCPPSNQSNRQYQVSASSRSLLDSPTHSTKRIDASNWGTIATESTHQAWAPDAKFGSHHCHRRLSTSLQKAQMGWTSRARRLGDACAPSGASGLSLRH